MTKFRRILHRKNEKGFTIVEVLIAFGLLAVLFYFIATQLENSSRGNQTTANSVGFANTMSIFTDLLNSPECTPMLKGEQFNPASTPIGNWLTIPLVGITAPGTLPGLQITQMHVNQINQDFGSGTYVANLNIRGQAVDAAGKVFPGALYSQDFSLYVYVAANQIVQCCTVYDYPPCPGTGGGGASLKTCAQLAAPSGDLWQCLATCTSPYTASLGVASDCAAGTSCCGEQQQTCNTVATSAGDTAGVCQASCTGTYNDTLGPATDCTGAQTCCGKPSGGCPVGERLCGGACCASGVCYQGGDCKP